MNLHGEPNGVARLLAEELVAAAASPGAGLSVIQLSRQGPNWKEAIDLQIELRVDRDAGGSIAVLIVGPYQGPRAPRTIFRIDPAAPTTTEAMVVALRKMFAAYHADPKSPWRFEQVSPDASGPVDEDWRAHLTASEMLDLLRRVRTGRGGAVAVAAVDDPLTVIRLVVSGRSSNLQVTGHVEPLLLGEPSKAPSPHRWSVKGDQGGALRLLRDVSAALARETGRDDPGSGDGLAARLETRLASKRASEAGCVPLAVVWIFTVSASWVLSLLGWPQTGIFFEMARRAREGATSGGAVEVSIALAIGVVPALLAMKGAEWVVDRRRLRYTAEGPALTAVALGVYAAWVAAVILTPLWSHIAGAVMIPLLALVALVGLVLALSWLHDWRKSRKAR